MATSLDDVGLALTEKAGPAFAGGNGNRLVERGKEVPSTGIDSGRASGSGDGDCEGVDDSWRARGGGSVGSSMAIGGDNA